MQQVVLEMGEAVFAKSVHGSLISEFQKKLECCASS